MPRSPRSMLICFKRDFMPNADYGYDSCLGVEPESYESHNCIISLICKLICLFYWLSIRRPGRTRGQGSVWCAIFYNTWNYLCKSGECVCVSIHSDMFHCSARSITARNLWRMCVCSLSVCCRCRTFVRCARNYVIGTAADESSVSKVCQSTSFGR